MRRLLPLATLAAIVVSLAACSAPAGTDASETPTTASAPATSAAATPAAATADADAALESIAKRAGVEGFTRSTSAAPGAIAWGQGTIAGSPVKVYEFADDAGYQAFVASVAGFGITEASLVRTGNFAIAPNDSTQLDAIRAAVG